MVNVDYDSKFKKIYGKLDKSVKDRVQKIILRIIEKPELGKPMKYARKGTREVYISPFRLSYAYIPSKEKIILLDLYHKDEQ
ncbi:type II toxin-antitoxin system RelE/ParE family toxin [Candidatus Pacearchaeota archaeon]|nr:type II toxin-antitoxin system RelE/ParE family toxin [Candidatus Pacearchaeota archaeon]